jgi:hypothetical protein
MRSKVIFCAFLVLTLGILAAGCTSSAPPQPVTTTVPTTIPPTAVATTALPTTTAGGSIQPGPTQIMPSQTAVAVSVEKGGMYSTTIVTTFDGGKGMIFVSRIDARVTHPDGSVVTGTMTKPVNGATLELAGTNGTDRVEVTVTMMSGDVYKVIDQQMPYKNRG